MSIKFRAPEVAELRPRITVLGVGGAGGNAVNNMIAAHLEGVDFVVANTDAQALSQSKAERRIQIGARVTEGLGAGARPDVGKAGAEESLDEILQQIEGSHMVFITAGMGGGTGTGAAPVIARAVREMGVLTVGVVTKPFAFEGDRRMRIAERGIEELQAYVDTLIIIPNQNLFRIANDRTTFAQAFAMADDVLHSGVRGVTDLIVMPGLINLDFADIKTVMSEMGKAMMGTGEADGEDRSIKAAEAAISNPLLDDVSMKGARGVLINITGGPDMMLFEVDQAANRIRAEVDPDANIIFGGTILENMEGRIRVSVVATGIEAEQIAAMPPNVEPLRPRAGARLTPTPAAATIGEARASAAVNPVLRQVEAISEELRSPLVRTETVANVSPALEEAVERPQRSAPTGESGDAVQRESRVDAPVRAERPLRAEAQSEEPRRRFGLWGRSKERKAEPRVEPAPARAESQRAQAQVMTRAEQRPQPADDLFADQKVEDQFEIPAFLRRQSN
ncbi:MAG: cell division protein FtsZ [Alphaproteobacteria bacterium]|nr:cell division protein FtsZ [Alphaproteobacteria bacterium]